MTIVLSKHASFLTECFVVNSETEYASTSVTRTNKSLIIKTDDNSFIDVSIAVLSEYASRNDTQAT